MMQVEKEELKLPTGTVLHFSGGTDQMKREDIKEALTSIGKKSFHKRLIKR